jgi:hypothetical protein
MIGDGQMSLGNTIVKHKTRKVRRIRDVLVGVAGSTADAATLLERFEKLLDESNGQLVRATVGGYRPSCVSPITPPLSYSMETVMSLNLMMADCWRLDQEDHLHWPPHVR